MKWGPARIFAEQCNLGRSVAIYMLHDVGNGKVSVAQPVTFVTAAEEEIDSSIPTPMLEIIQPHAQQLIDALWHAGLRPTQGKQSEGQVAAIGNHLEDMRAIAFAQLRTAKP